MNQLQKDIKTVLWLIERERIGRFQHEHEAIKRLEWYVEKDLGYETYTGEVLE